MRKFVIGILVLLALAIGALMVIPSLVPSSVYKEKIQTQLSKELARNVEIDGDVKISVFPSIRAKTDKVIIENPEGFSGDVFASMDGLDAKVKLFPLFKKQVVIKAFKLKKPVINLEINQAGQTNWAFGDPDSQEVSSKPEPSSEKTPFKRDGRYAGIDPAIGLFSIENGAISYVDVPEGKSHDLRDVNLAFSLPSLSKPVKIDGDFNIDGKPIDIRLLLNSPRDFLDGKEAPVEIDLKTDFADISSKGKFLAGEDIAFALNLGGEVSDIAALAAYLPSDMPIGELARSAKLDGLYTYDGQTFSASGANFEVAGDLFDAKYAGDATFKDKLSLTGKVSAHARNIPKIAKILDQDIEGIALVKTATLSADMKALGAGFSSENIKAELTGEGLSAKFDGKAAFDEAITASGDFTANAASVLALVNALKLDVPQAGALGRADVKGQLTLKDDSIDIVMDSAKTQGEFLTASYTGKIKKSGEIVSADGAFDVDIPSMSQFVQTAKMDIPYASSIGAISAKGNVSGAGKNITLSGVDALMRDGQINGQFTGQAALSNGVNLDGQLKADIPSIRALAATFGTALPPSTQAGPIYEAFAVSGQVNGTPQAISFKQANLAVDHLKGKGDFKVDLAGAKPFVTGLLDMEGLDLRPYMASYAEQNPAGEIQPWSEQPLNISVIKTVDGDFKFNTPNIITDRMKMGESKVDVTLRNGVLKANLPRINLYGGLGSLNASLDASKSVPAIALDVNLDDLNSNKFLGAVAGFTKASGQGNTALSIRGSGLSQAAIMKSLQGQGDFQVVDGELAGVDLSQLLSGLDTALATRALPSGIGSDYTTKFKDVMGLFKIENGVATIDSFNLNGFGAEAKGAGKVDIGNQTVDFSLQPRLTGANASNLASFGIPIRLQGGFGNVSAGLDTQLLGQIAAAQAKAKLQEQLSNQVGGSAGNILGGILGGSNPAQTGTQQPANPSDVATDLLGSILGSNKQETSTPSTESQPAAAPEEKDKAKTEPSIEGAILDIFGSKKKKKN